MELVGEEFEGRVNYLFDSWFPARELVQKAIEKRKEVRTLVFDEYLKIPISLKKLFIREIFWYY